MAYDHAQSARLGQRTPVESPGVQVCTLETLPEVAYRGQIVYLIDRIAFGVYDGDAWIVTGGGSGGGGGGPAPGSVVFVQATEPVADAIGNLWLSTVDYQLYAWDGLSWTPVTNTAQEINNRLSLDMAIAVGHIVTPGSDLSITVRYQGSTPSSQLNDFWVNTATNRVYVWTGSAYVEVTGEDALAIRLAGNARATGADQEISLYYGPTAPMGLGPDDIGDVWTNEVIQVWSGANWIPLQATTRDIGEDAVTGINIAPGAVDTPQLADSSIINSKIDLNAIERHNIADFAVSILKMKTLTHMIL